MSGADRWQPPIPAAAPRIVQPGQALSWTDARGVNHALQADRNGVVWPESPDEVILADRLGLGTATDWTFPEWGDPAPAEAEPVPATKLKLPELRERATELGVEFDPKATKAQLLEAVEAAEAAAAEATGDPDASTSDDETGDAGEED